MIRNVLNKLWPKQEPTTGGISRRDLLRGILSGAATVALAPTLVKKLEAMQPAKPDLRQIAFSIHENIGYLIFSPTDIQAVQPSRPLCPKNMPIMPIFTMASDHRQSIARMRKYRKQQLRKAA